MKWCNKCKKWKDESEFYKDKRNKDGLRTDCKKCHNQTSNEYYQNNREEENRKSREDYWNNREEKLQNYWNNKEKKLQKQKENNNSPLSFSSDTQLRNNIEKYEEIKESKNGNVAAKCAYDGGWFEPTKLQLRNRLDAINDETGKENRLYCSDKCKENCSIYKQHWYEKGYQPATSREVQPELRKMVFARDDYICQRCGYHKDEIGIECHHMEGVQQNPTESADMDICVTLCEDCHKKVHEQSGCKYHELRCSNV